MHTEQQNNSYRQQHASKLTGRLDDCILDSSVFSAPYSVPCGSLKLKKKIKISSHIRPVCMSVHVCVCRRSGSLMVVLKDQPNTCWPVELADTTAYDKERRKDVRADGSGLWLLQGVGSRHSSSLCFTLWSASVETDKNPPQPPPPTLSPKAKIYAIFIVLV